LIIFLLLFINIVESYLYLPKGIIRAAAIIILLRPLVFLTAKMNTSPIKINSDTMKPTIRETKVTKRLPRDSIYWRIVAFSVHVVKAFVCIRAIFIHPLVHQTCLLHPHNPASV